MEKIEKDRVEKDELRTIEFRKWRKSVEESRSYLFKANCIDKERSIVGKMRFSALQRRKNRPKRLQPRRDMDVFSVRVKRKNYHFCIKSIVRTNAPRFYVRSTEYARILASMTPQNGL